MYYTRIIEHDRVRKNLKQRTGKRNYEKITAPNDKSEKYIPIGPTNIDFFNVRVCSRPDQKIICPKAQALSRGTKMLFSKCKKSCVLLFKYSNVWDILSKV